MDGKSNLPIGRVASPSTDRRRLLQIHRFGTYDLYRAKKCPGPAITPAIKQPSAGELMPKDDPVGILARQLHWKMEHMDPSDNEDEWEWDGLTELQKEFYRACINAVLVEEKSLRRALALARDDTVQRRPPDSQIA